MCPFYVVKGRLGYDGARRCVARAGDAGAAAKASDDDQSRECVVIHQCPPRWSGAPETFGELNRRRCLRSLCKTFDASDAILSAQYDGLDMEDQLTCGARVIRVIAQRPPTYCPSGPQAAGTAGRVYSQRVFRN